MNPTIAEELFALWNKALATGNPEVVADLYAPDAVLLPTLSGRIRADRPGIVDYFTNFLENKPDGVVIQGHVLMLDNALVYSGHYTFTCRPNSAPEPYTVYARFTFVYRQDGDTWKIAAHHSSLLPEGGH